MAHLKRMERKKWRIAIELGEDPKTGRRKRKYKTVNGTKKEAQKIMLEMVNKYENGDFHKVEDITVKEFFIKWLKEYCKNNVAKNTYRDYEGVMKNHVIPDLGNLKLRDLQARHIIKYQNEKLENGRLDGSGGLSKRTVQNHHRIMSEALKHAVYPYKYIESNPCNGVKAPSPSKPDVNPFSDKEKETILKEIKNDLFLYSIVYIDLYTGLRRGEILAIKWEDINFKEQGIYIQRSVVELRGEGLNFKKPKNESSIRNIYIDKDIIKLLKKLKKHHLKINHEKNLVFTFEDGSIIRPDYITKKFKKILCKLGIRNHRFHDLRHTHATDLLKAGVNPKIVQERLGHHDIAVTLDIYSHVIPSMQENAIKKLKKLNNETSWLQNGYNIKNLSSKD